MQGMSVITADGIDRNDKGQFVPGGKNPNQFTEENALIKRENGVIAKQEKAVQAIKDALSNGDEVSWNAGLRTMAEALKSIIKDKTSKDVDKIRAFTVLFDRLMVDAKSHVSSTLNVQNNYFTDNPAAIDAFLSLRCPECDEIREIGVQHDCVDTVEYEAASVVTKEK